MMAKRALIVGAGGMGKAWGRTLQSCADTEVVGWVDVRPEAAEAAKAELGLEGIVTGSNLAKAAEAASPDFVVDVTVPEAHCEVTVTSLGMGLPVLGEKPMAASMQEARRMVEASERAGKLYMVSQSRRYDSRIVAFRDFVQRSLGSVGIVNADYYMGVHVGGYRDEMPSPLLLDMAIHTFDQMRFITGLDAVSVYAEEFNPSWSWYKGDASAMAIFELENGARFTYRGSWCAEGCMTSWESDWRVVGERGTAVWSHDTMRAETVKKTEGFFSEFDAHAIEPVPVLPGIEGSLREFLDALETGKTPNGECHDNIKSLSMVFSAMASSRSGRRVEVER
jgi:predicted dehydrogenase